jgi:hypothetical protein
MLAILAKLHLPIALHHDRSHQWRRSNDFGSGHYDRPGTGRGQRRRHRSCRGGSPRQAAKTRDSNRHCYCDRSSDCRRHYCNAVVASTRALAGGILLLWVCWKMWRELHMTPADHQKDDALSVENAVGRGETAPGGCVERRSARPRGKSLSRTSRCLWTMCWRSPARHASILLSFVDCPDGSCRQSNSATTPETPLDRLCRACNYSLRCLRNDISRKPRIDRRNQTSSAIADYPDI